MAPAKDKTKTIVDQDELWSDLTPIPQVESENPLVRIGYTPEFEKAMNLFRALVLAKEFSDRALQLTTFIIGISISHYTVWRYRASVLKHLHQTDPEGGHLHKELKSLNKMMLGMPKSYQAWHHRFVIVSLANDPKLENDFLSKTLEKDAKNYLTWTYRKFILCHFNRADMWEKELPLIEDLLIKDVRNNSAWNYRFFLVFEAAQSYQSDSLKSESHLIVEREIAYTQQQLLKVPNNESAWSYLRGVLKKASLPLYTVQDFVVPLTKTALTLEDEQSWPLGLNKQSSLPVPAAVELLADILVHNPSSHHEAVKLYKLLGEQLDPIRKGYWNYRSQVVQKVK